MFLVVYVSDMFISRKQRIHKSNFISRQSPYNIFSRQHFNPYLSFVLYSEENLSTTGTEKKILEVTRRDGTAELSAARPNSE